MATAKKAAPVKKASGTKKVAPVKKSATSGEPKKRVIAVKPKMTIPKELFDIWQKNKRKYDVEKLMAIAKEQGAPASKPTITKALKYGYIVDDRLVDIFNTYFANRYNDQKKEVEKLKKQGL